MTREEARERLNNIKWNHATNPCPDREALDMAIKALKEPILDKPHIKGDYYDGFKNGLRTAEWRYSKIKAEIEDWQTDIHDNEYDADTHDFVFERIYEIIDEYRAKSEDV